MDGTPAGGAAFTAGLDPPEERFAEDRPEPALAALGADFLAGFLAAFLAPPFLAAFLAEERLAFFFAVLPAAFFVVFFFAVFLAAMCSLLVR